MQLVIASKDATYLLCFFVFSWIFMEEKGPFEDLNWIIVWALLKVSFIILKSEIVKKIKYTD